MGFRITTGMMMNTYRYNLMNSTNTLNNSRETVISKRKFNSYADDPSAATHAWRIRRAYAKNYSYQMNNSDTFSRFDIAYSAVNKIKTDIANPIAKAGTIEGSSDPIGTGRQELAMILRDGAKSIINGINGAKYGDHFVFGGADALNVPFSWSEDGTKLYYRGIDVSSGSVQKPTAEELTWPTGSANAGKPILPATVWEGAGYASEADYNAAVAAWYNYNNDDTGTVAKPAGTEPMTAEEYQDWMNYYTHARDERGVEYKKPGSVEPSWLNDYEAAQKKANEADPDLKGDLNRIQQGWLDYYRHDEQKPPAADEPAWALDENGQYGITNDLEGEYAKALAANPNSKDTERAWVDYYKDQRNFRRLQELAEEETNVDLGLGLQENEDGEIVNGSVFNMALPGIKILGYGADEDGDPQNMALLMLKYADVLDRADKVTGAWTNDADREEADRLLNKIKDSNEYLIGTYASDIGAQAQFLKTNQSRLEDSGTVLEEQIVNLEQVDLADAITAFMWDYSCYSAALKIGNQLLSQSLIDYMS